MLCVLTLNKIAKTETIPVDGFTTDQTNPKSGFGPLVMEPRYCMKSKRKRSGCNVRFERSPSPDVFSNEDSEVPQSGVLNNADWSPEREMWPSEKLAVESGCPVIVVMKDIAEDSTGGVKWGR